MKREITRADIMDIEEYAQVRREKKHAIAEIKKERRLEVGPFATFYFENFETMLHQVQEMLFIERGGEDQIPDELAAYNPLIPNGSELVATVMFEIEDPVRRAAELARLGGVEETMSLAIDGEKVVGVPETDVDRTTAAGKASSVQFVHFPLTPDQAAKFKRADAEVVVAIAHPNYAHVTVMPETVRAALAEDLE